MENIHNNRNQNLILHLIKSCENYATNRERIYRNNKQDIG